MRVLDHLAVSAGTLAEGVAFVEGALGVTMAGGGVHAEMGTHNRLMSLGDLYLEVIAVDPAAQAPARPRWFDLDRFSGTPRLTNWVLRCDDLEAELALGPDGLGAPMAFARGDYRWRMAVPGDGRLPCDGACPALIAWQGDLHPARALPDVGVRLSLLEVSHPDAAALCAAMAGRLRDPRVGFVTGPVTMRATFATPGGVRSLG
jgi:hypothetical protein